MSGRAWADSVDLVADALEFADSLVPLHERLYALTGPHDDQCEARDPDGVIRRSCACQARREERSALWGERPAWFTWLHGAPRTPAEHLLARRTRLYIERTVTPSEGSR